MAKRSRLKMNQEHQTADNKVGDAVDTATAPQPTDLDDNVGAKGLCLVTELVVVVGWLGNQSRTGCTD